MATVQRVDTPEAAATLAALLNGVDRHRPIAVISIASGESAAWIDAEDLAREAGDLAEVYVMPTGAASWAFADQMSPGTQVFGGAGRVYPVGHEWINNLRASPLRFAYAPADGAHATEQLRSDLFRMAAAAGLMQAPTRNLPTATGRVSAVVSGRAFVKLEAGGTASIAEELVVPGVGIQRIVHTNQQVTGTYDRVTKRLDVAAQLLSSEQALAAYQVGDVVLTRVTDVAADRAELLLYPRTTTPAVVVGVSRENVTGNTADDLTTLMSVGEVIPARIAQLGPDWSLRLDDVDDDEPVVDSPALLPDGPSWLRIEDDQPIGEPETVAAPAVVTPRVVAPRVVAPAAAGVGAVRPAAPTPAIFAKTHGKATAAAAAPVAPVVPGPARPAAVAPAAVAPAAPAARPVVPTPSPHPAPAARSGEVAELTAEVAKLRAELDNLRSEVEQGRRQLQQLEAARDSEERRANRAENELKGAKQRLRKAGKSKATSEQTTGPVFADDELGFRYLVTTSWATRLPISDQRTRPLKDYEFGPGFFDSLQSLQGITTEKVADVVFEVLTGLAKDNPSRELHRLRSGSGGEDPIRSRPDGATPWRVSLQIKTPQARRLHYWERKDGVIELARVTAHDDFEA